MECPVIALSQLSRKVEERTDHEPQLSDLRESGSIEQDADIVCFIHRPEYYSKSSEDAEGHDIRGLAEFIIAKHRSGAVDTVKMRFRKNFAKFENWDEGNFNAYYEQGGTFESKMNSMPADAPLPPVGGMPPVGGADFMPDSGETPPPF